MTRILLLLLLVVGVVAVAVLPAAPVSAQGSAPTLIEWTQNCTGTVALVAPSTGDIPTATTCWVDGTTAVYFGGPATATTTGMPVCEDAACVNGGSGIFRAPVRRGGVGCITAGGTVGIRCSGPGVK